MLLQFTKMHGLGNDFVVIDAIRQSVKLSVEQLRFLADRHFGVGCDQILLVEPPQHDDVDFRYRIFNADGNEVEQCGNGARCFARFVRDKGLTGASEIVVETSTGVIVLHAHDDDSVTVDMGRPRLAPQAIPITATRQQAMYSLALPDGRTFSGIPPGALEFAAINMGNPHAVLRVEEVDAAPVAAVGQWLQAQPFFPESVNVGFMQLVARDQFRLRVYERGVGETRACGSGACAAMVAGVQQGWLDARATAQLLGGDLQLEYHGRDNGDEPSVMMTGPTASVFEGQIRL